MNSHEEIFVSHYDEFEICTIVPRQLVKGARFGKFR